jgi:hypothetical protein
MEQQPKPHVCRQLVFDEDGNGDDGAAAAGPSDIDGHFIDNFQEEMQAQLQAAIDFWNFDFKNDVPLEGRWKWEPVLQAESADEQMESHSETDQSA